jgi:L-ascorbate metabolism protein UlaG (beta-lactamase superfamily)
MLDEVQVITHSCIRITGEKNIYFDPYNLTEAPHDADIVFVTHEHHDHYSPENLHKVLKPETILVVPAVMAGRVRELGLAAAKVITAKAGDALTVEGLPVEAVAAYNLHKQFHLKAKGWVGYIVTMNQTRYYVSGDVDLNEDIAQVKCDVAIIPVGGTYTFNPCEAAEYINQLQPRFAVPTHYGSLVGQKTDGDAFAKLVRPPVQVVTKLRF